MKVECNFRRVKGGTSKNGKTYGDFLEVIGLTPDKAVQFSVNNTEADPELVNELVTVLDMAQLKAKEMTGAARASGKLAAGKALSLNLILEVEGEFTKPAMVPAKDGNPAHQKTWAGKPVFESAGLVKLIGVAGFAKTEFELRQTLVAGDFMSSAAAALQTL